VGAVINRYVFPDGDLQPVDSLLHALQDEGFEVRHVETLREHYATTLRHWVANLDANRSEAVRLAGSERERVWRLYMTGSAQAFEDGDLGVYQTLAYAGASSGTIAQTATVPTDQAVASSRGSAVA
jgi:cyclopropane-fatty-acyl-phospholipid synthase